MKYIVTHLSADLDSITSCWLIKRFLPGWKKAKIILVPAGSTLNNKPADDNPEVIHVDTGLGRFDHHQTDEFTCATKKVFEYLQEKKYLKKNQIKPLERIVEFVNLIDHFQEVYFPQAENDRYDFSLHQI
ncbi:MAG: chromate resistance protein ChrB domain-containing protein, partial [Microgenomates group bacterium]